MYFNIGVPLLDGSWVTQEMVDTAEAIYETFPDVEIMWIPRDKRKEGDDAIILIDKKTRDVIFSLPKEENLNQLVLQRLHLADRTKYTYEDSIKQLGPNRLPHM